MNRFPNSKDLAAVLLDILGTNANSMSNEVQTKLFDVQGERGKVHLMSVGDGAITVTLFARSRKVHRKDVLSSGAVAAKALVQGKMRN